MLRWFRRTLFGLTPAEKKVRKLRPGSTFKYKGKGYRVRANGRAYAIDGEHDDFFELMFLLDVAADGFLDFNFDWTPDNEPAFTGNTTPESIIENRTFGDESTIVESVIEESKAETGSKDEFQLEREIERPMSEPNIPESEPVRSSHTPDPEPFCPPDPPSYSDPEPSRSFSSGSYGGGDSGGYSSSDSGGGGGDCGGGCD